MQKVCVVIPCYNEALRLDTAYLSNWISGNSYIVLAVNDGSSDATLELLKQLEATHPEQFRILDLNENVGKAEAVRQGMLYVEAHIPCDYAGFWDADFSTPLEELAWFNYLSGGTLQHDLIMGSRISRLGAAIDRRLIRHYIGRVFATAVSFMMQIPLYDTQCGAKMLRSGLIGIAFGERFSSKWLFDIEIIYRLRNHFSDDRNGRMILEVPLRKWTEIGGSKLKLLDFAKAPLSLYQIWKRYGTPRRRATASEPGN